MEQLHFKPKQAKHSSVGAMLQEIVREACCELHGVYQERGFRFRKDEIGAKESAVIWCACPSCLAEEDAMKARAEEAMQLADKQAKLQKRLQHSWLPIRFIGKTFENFVCNTSAQQRVFDLVQAYARDFEKNAVKGRGLIFLGGVGTGKSHLAAAVLQAVMAKHQGLYMTVSDIIRAVRSTWRKDSAGSEREMLARLVEVDLLVMDEVGKQYGTEGEEHILFDVLDGRYREMKPTILLGNITGEELSCYLGERVADRLRETSMAIVFDWKSYREG